MGNKLNEFSGKTILVTGGTGSFGNAFAQQLLAQKVNVRLVLFSRDEAKQFAMRQRLGEDRRISFKIGDVRDAAIVRRVMEGVDYVFHAAALKQVPSCEFFPLEAAKTNILGTQNIIDACIDAKVSRAVFLSTDKAVYPVNAMGVSKAMMEKLVVAAARQAPDSGPTFLITRYGNVAGSRGSVIPHFFKQISKRQPLTITNPEMTRFLMKLEDAVDLVLYAMLHGKKGEILVKKAMASSILRLVEAFKLMYPDSLSQVIGTRNGEKLHESLIASEELVRAVDHGEYFAIPPESEDLDYERYFSKGSELNTELQYSSQSAKQMTVEQIRILLESLKDKLVPIE